MLVIILTILFLVINMFLKEDLSVKEIVPLSNWCSSGHFAPHLFRREGPTQPEEPTKFFQVTGKGIEGIYCELCLIVASWVAKQNKINKL